MDQFECRRAYARPGFSVIRGDLGYSKRLLGWEGLGQAWISSSARQALVSPEQILAGGMDSVRGYFEGEAAGDAGWRLRGEVKTPTLLPDLAAPALRALVLLSKVRMLWLNSPLPGQNE